MIRLQETGKAFITLLVLLLALLASVSGSAHGPRGGLAFHAISPDLTASIETSHVDEVILRPQELPSSGRFDLQRRLAGAGFGLLSPPDSVLLFLLACPIFLTVLRAIRLAAAYRSRAPPFSRMH